MDQIKIIPCVSITTLEELVNRWLAEQRFITVKDIKFVCGEYGRYFVIIHYEKDLAEEFIDKVVKGE